MHLTQASTKFLLECNPELVSLVASFHFSVHPSSGNHQPHTVVLCMEQNIFSILHFLNACLMFLVSTCFFSRKKFFWVVVQTSSKQEHCFRIHHYRGAENRRKTRLRWGGKSEATEWLLWGLVSFAHTNHWALRLLVPGWSEPSHASAAMTILNILVASGTHTQKFGTGPATK